tara:strand:+ start:507 stop:1031 length:525 start_codon:yes stop_codon:yes gene_type:complete
MGILKNLEVATSCIKKRVTFGKELHENETKPVKDFDGMCGKTKSWYHFVDLVFKLEVYPQLAWERVPPKHSDFVWGCILELLDKFMYKGRCISMPMGHRNAFYIGKRYYAYVDDLALWVRDQIYVMRAQEKSLEKIMGGWLNFEEDLTVQLCDAQLDSEEVDDMWDNIKENVCV